MNRRVTIEQHDQFHADVRVRLAATNGEPDPAAIVREIHAEVIERCGQRRPARATKRLLTILDELDQEGKLE